jgi:hypothetical protein
VEAEFRKKKGVARIGICLDEPQANTRGSCSGDRDDDEADGNGESPATNGVDKGPNVIEEVTARPVICFDGDDDLE